MGLAKTLAVHIRETLAKQPPPFLVAICGWADTGKSTLAKNLSAELQALGIEADWISTDAFMKDRAERNKLGITGYNHLSLDAALLASVIDHFVRGEPFAYCPYDNRTGTKHGNSRFVESGRVLVVEGIHALHPRIESRFSLKVFIDADEPTLRAMRQRANILKRGMPMEDAASRIQSEWEDFCSIVLPQKSLAHFVVQVSAAYEYSHPVAPETGAMRAERNGIALLPGNGSATSSNPDLVNQLRDELP